MSAVVGVGHGRPSKPQDVTFDICGKSRRTSKKRTVCTNAGRIRKGDLFMLRVSATKDQVYVFPVFTGYRNVQTMNNGGAQCVSARTLLPQALSGLNTADGPASG